MFEKYYWNFVFEFNLKSYNWSLRLSVSHTNQLEFLEPINFVTEYYIQFVEVIYIFIIKC